VRLGFANLTGPNLAPSELYDGPCMGNPLYTSTFTVSTSAASNASGSGNTTSTGSASPTRSTAPAITKSEGMRGHGSIGFVIIMAAIALML
jgi:cholinesterase